MIKSLAVVSFIISAVANAAPIFGSLDVEDIDRWGRLGTGYSYGENSRSSQMGSDSLGSSPTDSYLLRSYSLPTDYSSLDGGRNTAPYLRDPLAPSSISSSSSPPLKGILLDSSKRRTSSSLNNKRRKTDRIRKVRFADEVDDADLGLKNLKEYESDVSNTEGFWFDMDPSNDDPFASADESRFLGNIEFDKDDYHRDWSPRGSFGDYLPYDDDLFFKPQKVDSRRHHSSPFGEVGPQPTNNHWLPI